MLRQLLMMEVWPVDGRGLLVLMWVWSSEGGGVQVVLVECSHVGVGSPQLVMGIV